MIAKLNIDFSEYVSNNSAVISLAVNIGEAIRILEDKKLLIRNAFSLSPRHEIPYIAQRVERDKAILFENIEGYKDFRMIFGIYGDRRRLALTLGLSSGKDVYKLLWSAIRNPIRPNKIAKTFDVVMVGNEVDLSKLPIPTFYERDKGPYVTAGIVIAHDPETGVRNASYHRMTPIGKNKLVVRVVPRDLWKFLRKAHEFGKDLEAAVIIGVDPATAIAGATSIPIDHDELEVANAMLNGELKVTDGKTINVEYPAEVEIVLEGKFLLNESADEGPFTDITGTYDIVRKQPVFEVSAILMKRKPIFHAILPAGSEHRTLMGLPREAKIYHFVSEVTIVHDVYLADWGCGWLECVLAIEKRVDDEPVNAGLAAITAHPSLKKIIIVDPDINIRDCNDVYWAVITRAHPVRDYIIIPRAKGSTLEHTGEPKAKIIIDATIKGDKHIFCKAKIPASERVKNVIKALEVK